MSDPQAPIPTQVPSPVNSSSTSAPSSVIPGDYNPAPPSVASGYYSPPPSVNNIAPATPTPPDTQLAANEAAQDEVETRRARLSSDLLQQKHQWIETLVTFVAFVIMGLYLLFFGTVLCLFLSKDVFLHTLPLTAVVLVALTGSIPTILTISLIVGLFARESAKDEKSGSLDTATLIKIGGELLKYVKTH
jgi:hypothetical protein